MSEPKLYSLDFDTHIHTEESDCSNMRMEDVIDRAVIVGLNEIVIKNHDRIGDTIRAQEYAERHYPNFRSNLGLEARTTCGEIGVSFATIQELEEIMRLKENGIFDFRDFVKKCLEIRSNPDSEMLNDLHHPFDFRNPKRGFNFDRAEEEGGFEDKRELMRFFNFTEANTASTSEREVQAALVRVATKYNIPIVRSTDAHFLSQIGKYRTSTNQPSARDAIVNNDFDHRAARRTDDINYWKSSISRGRSLVLKQSRKLQRRIFG